MVDISIITPVYNGWEYLEQCATSIFKQSSGPTWEWWIGINGHGEGGGAALSIARTLTAGRPNVHVVNLHPLKGKVEALNALVGRTTGSWIAVLDCDDVWLPDKLAAQWAAIQGPAAGAAVVGTHCRYIGDVSGAGPVLPTGWIAREEVMRVNPIINSSSLVRREEAWWVDRCGLEDYDMWLRIAAGSAGSRLYNVGASLVLHRIHAGSAFNGKGKQDVSGLRDYWRPSFSGDLATVVSAFYAIPSKFPREQYIEWIAAFWTQTYCPLVFFTSPPLVPTFEDLLKRRPGPTRVVGIPFQELAALKKLAPEAWVLAREIDPEKGTNHSPELFAIWYEKKEFVLRAIELNPFNSSRFVWCDAGICRYAAWIPQLAQRFALESQVPAGKMLVLTIDPFKEEDVVPSAADGIKGDFGLRNSVGGGILASDAEGWKTWSAAYDAMLMRYYLAGRFIGKDQNIMGSMILERPELAVTVPRNPRLSPQQSWFSLLFYLAGLEPV
jgi:glycosyltransferase involved in cell wall biosynthesis